MKRIITLLLALTLCIGLALPALAKEGASTDAGLTRTVSERCYIDKEGNLWMWGSNTCGQCGQDLSVRWLDEPVLVMSNVVSVRRSNEAVIVLKADGTAWTWGYDFNHGAVVARSYSDGKKRYNYAKGPEPYKVADNVAAVSLGNQMQFGILKTDGTLWTWGNSIWRDLGYDASKLPDRYFKVPEDSTDMMGHEVSVPYKILDDVKSFAMGHYDGAAIKNDGSLWYWGNDNGISMDNGKQLGLEPMAPTKILDDVASFNLDDEWATAILTNGQAWQLCGNGVDLASRKKLADNVKQVVGPYVDEGVLREKNGSETYSFNYILYNDGKLYGKNGSEFIMDHVAWVDVCPTTDGIAGIDERNYASTYILRDDGVLFERKPVRDMTDPFNQKFLYYEIVQLAENVAIPGQPLDSLKNNSTKKIGGFADVLETDWFADPVLWAVGQQITTGTTATTFTPERTCTVAEILTFLWRAKGKPAPTAANPFTDVPEGQYYTDAAIWAYENGLVEGSLFNGGADCTRAMAVTYLWKLAGAPEADKQSLLPFADMPYTLKDPITWAVENNVTNGVGRSNDSYNLPLFAPDITCTRAQIVTFLYRAYANP